ncbi:MAG: leucine-rich repeat protein [Ruminiclostridium sp.]
MTKKLKRPLALLFSAAVFLALLMFAPAEITEGTGFGIRASAEEGPLGDDLFWVYDGNGTLNIGVIEETGAMPDNEAPWLKYIGKDSIKTVVIDNGVTSIGNNAFYGCYNLKSITIPDTVESIGNEAFYGCISLESVIFDPNEENPKLTSIGDGAFNRCSSLTGITIPDGVNSIGDSAFSGCSGLTSINIPDGVNSIGDSAFSGCSGLTSITIPDGVNSIGNGSFTGCSGLTSITIPDGVNSIGNDAFDSCVNLESVTFGENPKLTTIGDSAFYWCSSLKSITIPKSVNYIGDYAFWHCLSLTDITVAADNPNYTSTDGVLFNKAKTKLIQYPGSKSGDSYVIPGGVDSIGIGAFAFCENLKSITIPDSVTSIGDCAFWGCSSLTSINIPDGVTSIERETFIYCSSLTSITIPAGVTSIGQQAFLYCYSLTSIFFPKDAAIGQAAIPDNATQVKYTVTDENVTITGITLGAYLTSVVIPENIGGKNVASFGNDAVSSCTELTSIFFPESTDVTAAGIPDTATQVKYTVTDEKVTITGITLGTDLTSVDIPAAIGGYPVAAIAEEYRLKVGSHTHYYDSNNICTLCGIQPATKNADGYYEISNAGQLYWFAGLVNDDASVCDYDYETNPEGTKQDTGANAILTDNITVNTGVLDESGNLASDTSGFRSWTPIGINELSAYDGTFDGKNYTISGLYFNDTNKDSVGLFGFIHGTVKNVGVVDSYFSGRNYVGGVCANNEGGTITNCYNKGSVSCNEGFSRYIGGVCGQNAGGTIQNCYNTGSVSGYEYIGGVCGENNGEIANCYYLAETADENGGKTTAQFNSGEVAYLLSQGTDGSVWGQDLSTATNYPVLDSTKTVYLTTPCPSYSNEETKAHTDADENGTCDVCGEICSYIVALYSQPEGVNTSVANLEGGGRINVGESTTIVAPAVPGYTFNGWYKGDEETAYCTDLSFEYTPEADVTFTAKYTANAEMLITINGGDSYSVAVNNLDPSDFSGQKKTNYAVGTKLTLTAKGADFAYWENEAGSVLSRSAEYTFTVVNSATVTAVYNTKADGKATVIFISGYDQIIARDQYAVGDDVPVPAAPTKTGCDFAGWSINGGTAITENVADAVKTAITNALATEPTADDIINVKATYNAKTETITVTVTNGAGGGTYQINKVVTVTADTPAEGMKFSHWSDGTNTLSYNTSYSFYAAKDITVEAVYVADTETVTVAGTTAIVDVIKDTTNGRISFVSMSTVPEGCTIVKAGIVATSDSSKSSNLTEENADYVRGGASDKLACRYTWTKRTTTGVTWYVRAYLVYTDKNGNAHTIYSNSVASETL